MKKQFQTILLVGMSLLACLSIAFAKDSEQKASSTTQNKIKHKKIKGVEITAVNSTLQKGVKPAAQVNLEVALKLLDPKSRPKPKPKPAPGGIRKPKPKPKPAPGGKKDTRRKVRSKPRILNSGS